MNKKQKLTPEKKFLIWHFSNKEFTQRTLALRIQEIKRGVITLDALSPLERQLYDIFTTENAIERIAKFQEAYELMQKELNEI
jgi:hypothetical protein